MTETATDVERMVIRWREKARSGTIHADDAEGTDYTLCGFTTCEASGEDDQPEVEQVSRGKINCDRCLAIIRFSKSIPSRYLAAAKGSASPRSTGEA